MHPLLPVTADSNGNIISTEFVPDVHDIGIMFYVTAYGSSSQAQTTFSDSETLDSVAVGAQSPAAITPGSSATYLITVGFSKAGGNATCTADLDHFDSNVRGIARFICSRLALAK